MVYIKHNEYYFIYLGYEGKYLTENTYESVPTAGDLVLFVEINWYNSIVSGYDDTVQ